MIIHRAINGHATASELLHPYVVSRSLRSSDQGLLAVPCTKLKTKGDRDFETIAPRLLRVAASVEIFFKKQLKTHLFSPAFI